MRSKISRTDSIALKSRALNSVLKLRESGHNYGVILKQRYPEDYGSVSGMSSLYKVAHGSKADAVTTERLEALVSELCNTQVA